MRKAAILIFYSFFLLILGRNLLFIPQIKLGGDAKVKDPEAIRDEIITYLKTQNGDYNIYYEDLASGDNLSVHASSVVTAASLNKLPIVAYLYYLAGRKEVDLQDTIVIARSLLPRFQGRHAWRLRP